MHIDFDNRDSGHSTHLTDAPPPNLPATNVSWCPAGSSEGQVFVKLWVATTGGRGCPSDGPWRKAAPDIDRLLNMNSSGGELALTTEMQSATLSC